MFKDDDKKEEKPKQILSGNFSAEELVNLIGAMAKSNQEALKEFAAELAFKLAHPEPTETEKALRLQQVQLRIDRAREEDAQKDHKRKHCVHPARPAFPHRRYGMEWGMFNNTSVIAWHYTTLSERTFSGVSKDGMQVALGVCQWCGTEFKPGDEGYEDAVNMGLSTAIGTYPMNQRTGIWS